MMPLHQLSEIWELQSKNNIQALSKDFKEMHNILNGFNHSRKATVKS